MMTDPVGDMLIRIKNAVRAGHDHVKIPASKLKYGIAAVLKREGFIKDFTFEEDGKQGIITIYFKEENPIRDVKRISKPGRRVYVKAKKIPRVLNGLGIAILSTSKGVLSDREARQLNVGGELIAYVW